VRTWILFVVVVFAVSCQSGDPMAADPSGKALFKTTTIPDWEFDVQCNGADQPTVTSVNYKDTKKRNRRLDVEFTDPQSKDCVTSSGKPGKTTSWKVRSNKTYEPDLGIVPEGESPEPAGWESLGRLDCPCTAVEQTLLNLKWKDFQMIAYPGGERATYYNVRFNLSEAGTGKELATWTAWVRLPGGHTHYGHLGSKLIEVDPDSCSPGANLVECAQRAAGQDFAQPPAVPAAVPVG
jgi:hypothetical protein